MPDPVYPFVPLGFERLPEAEQLLRVREFLARMAAGQAVSRVHVSVGEGGQFEYEIS